MREKILKFLKDKRSGKLLFIVGIAGIVLIYVSTILPDYDDQSKKLDEAETFSEEEYALELEEKVERMVSAICGDNGAVVTVTLDTTLTYEYADEIKQNNAQDETKSSKESEKTYIIVKDSQGAETPLIITSYMPKIRGVAIICNANELEREEIKNAVTAALNINSREIYIGSKGRTTSNEKG